MHGFQRIGAVAAFAYALLAVASLGVGAALMAATGAHGATELVRAHDLVGKDNLLHAAEGLKLASAFVLLFVVSALRDRLADTAPDLASLAVGWGVIAAAFLVASGIIGYMALEMPATQAEAAPLVAQVVVGLGFAAVFASGVWLLLNSAIMLRRPASGRLFGVIGIAAGAADIAAFAFPPAVFVGLILGILWSFGVGFMLVRRPRVEAAYDT